MRSVDTITDVCTELRLIKEKYSDLLSVSEEVMINNCIEKIKQRSNEDNDSDE